VASLSQGRTAAAQCGLFTHKSVPVIFEPPCILHQQREMAPLNGSKHKLCWGLTFLTSGAICLEVIPRYRFRVLTWWK